MELFKLESLQLWWLIGIFIAGAGLVWWSGFRISIYANTISNRTGIGKAFIGALFLGAITSLPEVATTITASFDQNVDLAANNLIGGVTLQVAILAVADYFVKNRGVTSLLTKPIILLQGILFIFLLSVTIAGALVQDTSFLGIGLWVWLIFLIGLLSFYLIHRYQGSEIFLEVKNPAKKKIIEEVYEGKEEIRDESFSFSDKKLYGFSAMLTFSVLIGGYFCAETADLIAQKTGLGVSFMGIFFLALATSLPELSTTISAMRIREYELAFSDIFGTNIFDILLLFIADIIFTQGLIMNKIQNISILGSVMGIAITSIFLMGIIVKPRKNMANFGLDSIAVLLIYFAGLIMLYTMRGNS